MRKSPKKIGMMKKRRAEMKGTKRLQLDWIRESRFWEPN